MYELEVAVDQVANGGGSCNSMAGVQVNLTYTNAATGIAYTIQVPLIVSATFSTPPISGQLTFVNTVSGSTLPTASGHFLFSAQGGTPVKVGTLYSKSGCTGTPTYTIAVALKNEW